MKKHLIRLLIALLLLALPASAQAVHLSGLGFMYEGGTVSFAPSLAGVPVELLQWSSSDESVVTADVGRLDAHAAGRAVVGASLGGRTAYCGVVVLPREVSVGVGQIISLPCAGAEKFYIEHADVALVNQGGQILGVRAGSTRVGIAYGSQRMIVNVNVVGGESAVAQSAAAGLDCAPYTDQIVLVEYQGGSAARISIHEKQSGLWKELWSGPACVGRNGIGKTREGDGRTPSGTYNLTQPFGICPDPGSNMGYTQVTRYHYWCGTSGSEYYNRMVDGRLVNRAPTSSDEYLINYGSVYNYCMFIDYNAAGEAGRGSCIFLHCKGSANSTSGCIAVSEDVMRNIIRWARPGAKIVIR